MDENQSFNRIYREQMTVTMSGRFDSARLENMRGTSIGGASLSTALVFLLLQTKLDTLYLQASLTCAVIAIPAWIATWQMVEAYQFCGESSYGHFFTIKGSGIGLLIFLVAALSLFLGLCALLWHLVPFTAVLFAVLCVAMCFFAFKHNNAVRAWSDEHRGQGT